MQHNIPIVPGRGLNVPSAIKMRQEYIENEGYSFDTVKICSLQPESLKGNIESLVGSVEIPLGLVGPLLFNNQGEAELCYTMAATLEGALVASMNRGAKAISQSGGFSAAVLQQRMMRAPLFQFSELSVALHFTNWIAQNFSFIKQEAESYSNHAKLIEIEPVVIGRNVHLRFIFGTGDASGQNMTTTCTWHAVLWIAEKYHQQSHNQILHFVLEGNGASDKKFSHNAQIKGRGIHVVAECRLNEEVIRRVLRTTSDDLLRYYSASLLLSKLDGMAGYSINVANAVAAIFAATGQDLASIHESGSGLLFLEKTDDGLYLSLNLPNLVIGTVGGGTHLPAQSEILNLMGCKGNNRIERFANLIAGFALGLEISTYSAMVSGQFAKAHEKLGRNKPVQCLTRAEINVGFVKKCLDSNWLQPELYEIEVDKDSMVENGIITALTNRVVKKTMGFIPVKLTYSFDNQLQIHNLFLKSKPLDLDVIKGLHAMAAAIDPELSDLLHQYKSVLEYTNCHLKEIVVYEELSNISYDCMPKFYGSLSITDREIYVFLIEKLNYADLLHHDSQKNPEWWTDAQKVSVIRSIAHIHKHFKVTEVKTLLPDIQMFYPWKAVPLYRKLLQLMIAEPINQNYKTELFDLLEWAEKQEFDSQKPDLPQSLIHNDFNSRNIAIRKNGTVCIYDWELAVINLPHRDLVEFLSFVLMPDFTESELVSYLRLHFTLVAENENWDFWKTGYEYALKEYIVTRISFYEVAGILARYAFSERVLAVSFRMLNILKNL